MLVTLKDSLRLSIEFLTCLAGTKPLSDLIAWTDLIFSTTP